MSTFWTTFGAILGTILGPDRAKKGPRWAQEGHQELQRPKKLHFQKVVFALDCLHFFAPEASQDSLKRPKKPPKRPRKSSKTLKKKGSKNRSQKCHVLDHFWLHFGVILGPKSAPKMMPKMGSFLGPLLLNFWSNFRNQNGRVRRGSGEGPEKVHRGLAQNSVDGSILASFWLVWACLGAL